MNTEQKKLWLHPYAWLLIAVLAVAISSIIIKFSSAPSSVAGMYRLFITVVIMLPLVPWKVLRTIRLTRKEWMVLSCAGFFLGLHFLLWMESLKYTSVASSMVFITLQPFFVMLGSFLLFKERSTIAGSLCMAMAVLGSFVIAWGDIGISREALFGDLLSLLGTMAVAVYMIAGQQVSRSLPSNLYSLIVFLIAGTVMFVYNLVNQIALTGYAAEEWMYFALLAIIPTIFGHLVFNMLLKHIGATNVSMAIIGEPVLAMILAYFLLNEYLGTAQMIGSFLTIAGMGMFFRLRARQTAVAAEAGV
ncbi:Threonine/homoserine efflux transporter RhtA [Paenibacillus algorifonticola]|uniref:Threonine/homoserine efflux transporter RhtA n=1 Tax=Paenibacillus algorifonticola TaxID=684063 RepID=A0A1I1ZZ60_9BACL|nr:DMT family transporter [Paenibacillus algorifonticola]SFE36906.1 Threonine/homoserine efflux transporter RhtA [Paenibacillus algorifonticola]